MVSNAFYPPPGNGDAMKPQKSIPTVHEQKNEAKIRPVQQETVAHPRPEKKSEIKEI